ncbi:MAG: RNA-binding transcriptional accessory protein [Tenericutes bacterium GWC2_34_14]|nr:MAG: RNA-binding transcriptional accessory protein [Tenericutes bacterium GWA2_35_7]OHE28157.1 MAG: RNA-binding transcriptional accessory protein [Tenericutes bacterium GWC2_34_14]OHE32903.1 MAG: RNA-binding transcriptional accessory protein [Tenericutes bacterium GWE2_34_108]OHE36132.1 MAG: RNA-binding transcriptional accessory protein [Tenericutes bacterium GWF1_35_14]OHE39355.1 MAG: RNA-binding transcriptional accessory protein [Tenericutes bacterium GWF2_35_184]OHE43837.1 MAG: RNA-bindi
MNEQILLDIQKTLSIPMKGITTVLELLEEGNTIPFIARYRKEATGGLDEEQINEIYKTWEYQNNLLKRKEDVIRLIDEKGMLTEDLKKEILSAQKLVEVEDLYRPFKEKKKTKATEAVAKGLEPLANFLMMFTNSDVNQEAKKFLKDDVPTEQDAIEGAKYIIAEMISDDANYRKALRQEMVSHGVVMTSVKKNAVDEKKTYEMYYEYQEPVSKIRPHRILAINRAENEKVLTVKIESDKERMTSYLERKVIKREQSPSAIFVKEAIEDALKRLIYPSLDREVRAELTEKGEEQAIEIFAVNLQKLLLQPPMKGKVVLGVDPAFRTGCKLSVVNEQGTVLEKSVIYPHEKTLGGRITDEQVIESQRKLLLLIKKYKVEIIAIGNGTASRETESFVAELIKSTGMKVQYVIVNEAGASVYSASELAREEFPDFSVEERSAASIARRLQDPLSELVKIDPKSIGVGQYQHDVTPKKLNDQLNFVVTQAVNQVGVNVNTASKALLMYVSGLNKSTAENIVKFRDQSGKFIRREDLLKVPKLGGKTYEQSIGFLRIPDGDEALDMTAVHPESYGVAKAIMKRYNITGAMFGKDIVKDAVTSIDRKKLQEEMNVDKYTLDDILDAFIAPLRDPREQYAQPLLRSDILKLDDLSIGMELEGTVRNVVDFGAFIDIGLKEDGLLHISKISKSYIKHPKDVLNVGDIVKVYVLNIDLVKGKVGLTMLKETIGK